MKSILTVIGTRPEAIKLAPVLRAMQQTTQLKSKVCNTKQHTDLLEPILSQLGIETHYQLENPFPEGTLHQRAGSILTEFESVLRQAKPDLVLVQGDTTTAFATALAAFYLQIPVAHVEAGLRTGHLYSPWPEEAHRCLIARLTTYFFAPTQHAKDQLLAEGIPAEKIWVVGNTSIDALRLMGNVNLSSQSRTIVVTVHRRENQGLVFQEICKALSSLAELFNDVQIVFVLHANPAFNQPARKMLSGIGNIRLQEPMDHSSFIQLLRESLFILTDSGGIQEETSFLGKPTLVLRDSTERTESIRAGTAKLVGTDAPTIVSSCRQLLENESVLSSMSRIHFSYGDGYAGERIVAILENELGKV